MIAMDCPVRDAELLVKAAQSTVEELSMLLGADDDDPDRTQVLAKRLRRQLAELLQKISERRLTPI